MLVVGHGFKALPEDDGEPGARDKGLAASAAVEVAGDPIDVPRCRQLSKSRKTSDGNPRTNGNRADPSLLSNSCASIEATGSQVLTMSLVFQGVQQRGKRALRASMCGM